MLVCSICLLLAIGNTVAVVNNGATSKSSLEPAESSATSANTETKDASSETIADLLGASSETEANKREAVIDINNNFATVGLLDGVYGPPIDSYLPATTLNVNLPLPVYGAPNIGSNIVYPTLPPDILPHPPLPLNYGVPSSIPTASKDFYAPLKFVYGPPKNKPIKTKYGLPLLQRPPKPINPSYFISKAPKPIYGPPRIHKPHINKFPKLQYGPPQLQNSPPKLTYGPPKQVQIQTTTLYIPPTTGALLTSPVNRPVLSPPPLTQTYGIPNINLNIIKEELPLPILPQKQYGPPQHLPHGPPHPGIPAPPTPPDIKYDGWQPIPGLISRPPSATYGVPNTNQANHGLYDIQINGDFTPPPVGGTGVQSLSLQESYKGNGVVSDSYAAPLNTVTGSGGVDATSGEEHHQQSQGSINIGVNNELNQQEQHEHQSNVNIDLSAIGIGEQDNSLSVIKSVGYQLFPNYALGGYTGIYPNGQDDTYTAPPLNSYSPNGPYPPAQPYKPNILSQSSSGFGSSFNSGYNSHSFGKEISLSPTGVGLIPPSGVYGVTPNTQYGTPLFQSGSRNLNNFKLTPPKRPVIFREPVPVGLIQSIGHSVAQKDASGIIDSVYSNNVGPTYIPPPVPEIIKPVKEVRPFEPSNLYSLPHVSRPASFQNFVQGSSTAGLTSQFDAAFNLNTANDYNFGSGAHSAGGYQSNFGSLHGAYALPLQTSPVAFNTNQYQNKQNYYKQFNYNQLGNVGGGSSYNLFAGGDNYGLGNAGSYRNIQHDCNVHSSQPLPSISYGVPSGSGAYQTQPAFTYGTPDLEASHTQSTLSLNNGASSADNSINEFTKDNYAKSLGETFANGGEVFKSQSIDLNNIPLQGDLGSYTLQIQSADGLGSTGPNPNNVPHEQVLNDGLLQSILAAIEQPQGSLQVQADQSQSYSQIYNPVQTSELESRLDEEAQHSVKNAVVVTPPLENIQENSNNTNPQQEDSNSLQLIDNNEVAVYFNNTNAQTDDASGKTESMESKEGRNGQQYGSYVAFKTPTSSYVYGDLESADQKETLAPNKED